MDKIKLIFIILIFSSLKASLLAVKYDNKIYPDSINVHYLSISPFVSFYKHLDFQNSPILYKGPTAGIGLSFESDGNNYKYAFILKGAYGFLGGETKTAIYSSTQINAQLGLNYVHRITPVKSNLHCFTGASIQGDLNMHNNPSLQNASLSLTGLTNFAFSTEFESDFSWKAKNIKIWFLKFKRRKRNFKINLKFDLPLLFLNFRPGYSNISDFTNGENLWALESKQFWIFKNAFQLNTKSSFFYFLNNKNALRISYIWQAFRFEDTFDSYQAAHHSIEFSLLFRFN